MANNRAIKNNDLQELSSFEIYELATDTDASSRVRQTEQMRYEILWVPVGSGIYIVDGIEFPFNNNTIFCGTREQLHPLKSNTDVIGYVISFTKPFLRQGSDEEYGVYYSEFVALFTQIQALSLQPHIADEVSDIAARMKMEHSRDHLRQIDLLRRYLKIILLYVLRLSPKRSPLLKRQKNGLVISADYLNEIVLRVSGNTPANYIRQTIIAEAKLKATNSKWYVKMIAKDFGFDTPSDFRKFLKRNAENGCRSYKKVKARSADQQLSLPLLNRLESHRTRFLSNRI
jgi:AraC-like DNA-binding protein